MENINPVKYWELLLENLFPYDFVAVLHTIMKFTLKSDKDRLGDIVNNLFLTKTRPTSDKSDTNSETNNFCEIGGFELTQEFNETVEEVVSAIVEDIEYSNPNFQTQNTFLSTDVNGMEDNSQTSTINFSSKFSPTKSRTTTT